MDGSRIGSHQAAHKNCDNMDKTSHVCHHTYDISGASVSPELGRRRGRREAEGAFDIPDDVFRQHFRLRKETVRWLCYEVAEELGGVRSTALTVERQVLCALRFFATGSFQGSVGSEETIGVTQPAVSKCVRRVAEAIVHAGTRNKWAHYPRTSEEKAAVKEGFLRRGGIPGVIGCVDGSLIAIIAPKGDNKAAYMCRKGFYALNSIFCTINTAGAPSALSQESFFLRSRCHWDNESSLEPPAIKPCKDTIPEYHRGLAVASPDRTFAENDRRCFRRARS
ncbi:hypothetical protein HPB49_021411 [Dermacentor silvarum]|uniref:Uncharacterized protein n=1 Tax=Dermacentor silvarum TaxID=543639 RepID=A0ACB8E390_DERSI|nr:hypothetical protein HPB49_021411 [Dermacentor silvarum]